MMKKSLIALAVMAASGAAFAATSNVDVGGQIRISADKSNNGGKLTLTDRASRLNITGSEDLGGGLKAFYHAEWNIDAADGVEEAATSGTGSFTTRQTYVGVQGAFGKVLAGKAYAPYKLIGSASVFEDTAADSQGDIVGVGHDAAYSQALAYISPDFNNAHIAVAYTNAGTASVAVTDSVSAVVVYANGPLKASYGYESQGDKTLGGATTTTDTGSVAQKLNLSYKMGDVGMAYTYEKTNRGTAFDANGSTTDVAGQNADLKNQIASLTYGMGPITLAAQYGKRDAAGGVDYDIKRTTVGAIYSLSKRTSVAAAFSSNKANNVTKTDTTTVQLNHAF